MGGDAADTDLFVTGMVAPDDLDPVARAVELIGKESNQALIRGIVDRGRGQGNAKFLAEGAGDGVFGGARLDF